MNHKLLSIVILAWLSLSCGVSFGNAFTLERTFDFNNPGGIAVHPVTGNLFIASGAGVFERTPLGVNVSSFGTPGFGNVRGITFLPNGNPLLLGQGAGAVIREFSPTGGPAPFGIRFPITPATAAGSAIAFNAATNSIFLLDGRTATVYEYDLLGNMKTSFLTTAAVPSLRAPKSITVNPASGTLIVADRILYEFTTTGRLASTLTQSALISLGMPAGIAIDPATRGLYLASAQRNVIGVFQFGAFGISLSAPRNFTFANARDIAVNPRTGNVFLTTGAAISEVTPAGAPVASFPTTGIGNVQGLTVRGNGNLLLLIRGPAAAVVREYTTAGMIVPMGASFPVSPQAATSDKIAFNPLTGTIFLSGGDGTIYEYGPGGALLSSFLTTDAIPSLRVPRGLAVDPANGNLMAVDNVLYELTTTGRLQNAARLVALRDRGLPTGIAIDRASRNLFIAFGPPQNIVSVYQFDGEAEGVSLTLEGTFDFDSASGIAVHPTTRNLFIADGIGRSVDIFQVTPMGITISSFSTMGLGNVQGLTFRPNGNLLLPFQSDTATIGENRIGGVAVPRPVGINFSTAPDAIDIDGIAFNPSTNTIFAADDDDSTIYQYSLAGLELSRFRTTDVVARFREPEGITINPWNGNLIIVDDGDSRADQRRGSSSLYEFTTTGLLINAVKMPTLSGLGDPEGVAIDPVAQILYIAYDAQNIVGVFSIKGLSRPPRPAIATVK